MKDGWNAFSILMALLLGWWVGFGMSWAINARHKDFSDCVLEQRGTVQECAVKSGRWEQ